jgi:hypothetical protein
MCGQAGHGVLSTLQTLVVYSVIQLVCFDISFRIQIHNLTFIII